MTTTVNNTVENNVVVANNEGYNANVTNEVVVLNGDTFYRKNMVEGQKYRYGSHYFVIDKFEMRGTHLYYCGTLDNKPFEGDLHSLKVACECTERRQKNASANDTENGKAVKVKRTSKETAELVEAKYNKAISSIEDIISKLNCSEEAKAQATELVCVLIKDKCSKVEAINNEAKAKQAERLNRIEELYKMLPDVQGKAVVAMGNGDFDAAAELAKQAKELKAELDALQAEETAYIASLAPASEDAEDAGDNK